MGLTKRKTSLKDSGGDAKVASPAEEKPTSSLERNSVPKAPAKAKERVYMNSKIDNVLERNFGGGPETLLYKLSKDGQ